MSPTMEAAITRTVEEVSREIDRALERQLAQASKLLHQQLLLSPDSAAPEANSSEAAAVDAAAAGGGGGSEMPSPSQPAALRDFQQACRAAVSGAVDATLYRALHALVSSVLEEAAQRAERDDDGGSHSSGHNRSEHDGHGGGGMGGGVLGGGLLVQNTMAMLRSEEQLERAARRGSCFCGGSGLMPAGPGAAVRASRASRHRSKSGEWELAGEDSDADADACETRQGGGCGGGSFSARMSSRAPAGRFSTRDVVYGTAATNPSRASRASMARAPVAKVHPSSPPANLQYGEAPDTSTGSGGELVLTSEARMSEEGAAGGRRGSTLGSIRQIISRRTQRLSLRWDSSTKGGGGSLRRRGRTRGAAAPQQLPTCASGGEGANGTAEAAQVQTFHTACLLNNLGSDGGCGGAAASTGPGTDGTGRGGGGGGSGGPSRKCSIGSGSSGAPSRKCSVGSGSSGSGASEAGGSGSSSRRGTLPRLLRRNSGGCSSAEEEVRARRCGNPCAVPALEPKRPRRLRRCSRPCSRHALANAV